MNEDRVRADAAVAAAEAHRNDRWYPTFHIAAAAGWINDPNGLSFFKGRYHVFFQHHPYSTAWGPMHWGHVSSEDLVTWRREPIACAPSIDADRDGVFSGSAVVSEDGETLYAYYTGNRWGHDDAVDRQVQCMAISEDGVTFEKLGVVVEGPSALPHFRDPKVWKMAETWYMVVGACSPDNRGQVWLYTSEDARTWAFDSVLFEDPNPDVFMLECPDLFPVGEKWVVSYCPMGTPPQGYSHRNTYNAGYVVGDWAPGQPFVLTGDYTPTDWGHNFYAPQSFESPDGRRIQYGWMGAFENPLPPQLEDGWSGQLTVPRVVTLGEEGELLANPVEELTRLRTSTKEFGPFVLGRHQRMTLCEDAQAIEIECEVDLRGEGGAQPYGNGPERCGNRPERFGFDIHKTVDGHHSYVYYDDLAGRVGIDHRLTYAGERGYRAAPVVGDTVTLRIFIDRGSVEVFANGGKATLSSCSFPGAGKRAVELVTENAPIFVKRLTLHELGTVWEERGTVWEDRNG